MRTAKTITLALLLCCNICFATIKEDVAKTIVRIRSGTKYSTGFFWKDGTTVLTTLHSLSSTANIEVYIPSLGKWRNALLKRVFKNGDLILLKVLDYSSTNFLSSIYNTKPAADTKAFTIGYNSGSTSYIDRDFAVGFSQGNTLGDLLPGSSQMEINKLGFPSLTTQIIYLKGNLLHGFSGAPILDMQGRLMGIADGGLENGAAGISWCINSTHIITLETSTESSPVLNQSKINSLFAAEEYENRETPVYAVSLNGLTFKKVKTRTFAQMDFTGKFSSMDAFGLTQLLATFSMFNYSAFEYDVYLEESSGATIVLPAGETLTADGILMVAGTEKIKYFLAVSKTFNAQASSEYFESLIMPYYFTNWLSDPAWSYPSPYPGANNSLIRRRAYFGNGNRNYLFEALAANQQFFLGAAARRDNYLMSQADTEAWARYAIAIQLTSFTN